MDFEDFPGFWTFFAFLNFSLIRSGPISRLNIPPRRDLRPRAIQRPQSQFSNFKKFTTPHILPNNSSPNIVSDPFFVALDLTIYCLSNLWDPSRVVRAAILYRKFGLRFLNEFTRVELSHFPSENLSESPISGLGVFRIVSEKK